MKVKNIVVLALAFAAAFAAGCGSSSDNKNASDTDVIEEPAVDGDEEAAVEETVQEEVIAEEEAAEETAVEETAEEPAEYAEEQAADYEVITTVPVCDGYPCKPAEGYGYTPGMIVENWTLKDADGNDVSLKDYFGGYKAVFINQSAGWCSVCRAEAPRMKKMWDTFAPDGLIILQMIFETNVQQEPADVAFAKSWRDEYGFAFPVLADPDNILLKFHPSWKTGRIATPLNMILDSNMRINFVVEGDMPQSIEGQICTLLGRDDCYE